jgi:hypothetical protein
MRLVDAPRLLPIGEGVARCATRSPAKPFGAARVTVGAVEWETSLFADTQRATYLLPVKADVRRRVGIEAGDAITLTIASLSSFRCRETAGRLIGSSSASSRTDLSPDPSSSTIARRRRPLPLDGLDIRVPRGGVRPGRRRRRRPRCGAARSCARIERRRPRAISPSPAAIGRTPRREPPMPPDRGRRRRPLAQRGSTASSAAPSYRTARYSGARARRRTPPARREPQLVSRESHGHAAPRLSRSP